MDRGTKASSVALFAVGAAVAWLGDSTVKSLSSALALLCHGGSTCLSAYQAVDLLEDIALVAAVAIPLAIAFVIEKGGQIQAREQNEKALDKAAWAEMGRQGMERKLPPAVQQHFDAALAEQRSKKA